MSLVLKSSLLALLLGALSSGCAANLPRPIQTDAALGRVVIYRNGVAYFERRAVMHGDKFALSRSTASWSSIAIRERARKSTAC